MSRSANTFSLYNQDILLIRECEARIIRDKWGEISKRYREFLYKFIKKVYLALLLKQLPLVNSHKVIWFYTTNNQFQIIYLNSLKQVYYNTENKFLRLISFVKKHYKICFQ